MTQPRETAAATRRHVLARGALCVALAAPAALAAETQPASAAAEDAPMDMDAMMARWLKLGSPSAAHDHFKHAVGKWKTRTRVQMGPDAPTETSHGTCTFELVLGGRYLLQKCKGEMLGRRFEGIGLEGYDNYRKQYVSIWTDNMGTAPTVLTGTCDAPGENCVYHGTIDDALTGHVGKTVRAEAHRTGDDGMVFEMYDAEPGGEWHRVMDVTYKRLSSGSAADSD